MVASEALILLDALLLHGCWDRLAASIGGERTGWLAVGDAPQAEAPRSSMMELPPSTTMSCPVR